MRSSAGRLDVRRQKADDGRLGTISIRAWRVVLAVAFAVVAVPRPAAQGLVATDLLDRYCRGEFDAVVASLEKVNDFDDFLKRMGAICFRQRNDDRAIALFEQVKPRTRDPWVVYLAEYFKGQALERRKRPADAERAYRGAVAAVPGAQSASVALAALLFQSDRRTEASDVITTMLARRPRAVDPWRGYAHADDRFWPILIARLRAEIRR